MYYYPAENLYLLFARDSSLPPVSSQNKEGVNYLLCISLGGFMHIETMQYLKAEPVCSKYYYVTINVPYSNLVKTDILTITIKELDCHL